MKTRNNHNATSVRYCSNCRAYIVSMKDTGRCQDCGMIGAAGWLVGVLKPSSQLSEPVRKPGRGEL